MRAGSTSNAWRGAAAVFASEVAEETHSWLWPGRVPLRALTVLDGDPGLGKSLIALDLIARVTTGRPMPDGAPGRSGGAVLLSAEDDPAETILPRLRAAGADLSKVLVVRWARVTQVSKHEVSAQPLMLPRDIAVVATAIDRARAGLVVIDPLMAYLERRYAHARDAEMRQALAPLARLADQAAAAFLLIRHLTKTGGPNALYRGGGTIGIIGVARAGLLVAPSPDDPQHERILASTKSNLGPAKSSLRYRIASAPSTDKPSTLLGQYARIEWLGETDDAPASLLVAGRATSQSPIAEACAFLREALHGGPRPATEVEREARIEGIIGITLKRARTRLGVRARREGYGPGSRWLWEWPADPSPANDLSTSSTPDASSRSSSVPSTVLRGSPR